MGALAMVGAAWGPALAQGAIRVALSDGPRSVELGAGPFTVQDLAGQALSAERPTWVRVVLAGAGVEVRGSDGRALRAATGIRVVPLNGAVRVNQRDYPGTIEVHPSGDGLLVVNELSFEDYVAGAVRAEAGERMPLEMLKAQAIVARTYAAYHRRLNSGRPFHIVAGTIHQQYLGRVPSVSPVWEAVRDTDGQVLLWEGGLFPAFYHTDSGGHTEDPRSVFAAANMPALRPVRVDFVSDSPHHLWRLEVPLADLASQLRRGGIAVGQILGLDVLERSVSLRVARIAVRGTAGTAVLRGNEFRRLLGYDTLKSTLFAVAVDDGAARFAGRGYGHGVGMDQSIAKTMALLGYGGRQIVEYFFPGATMGSLGGPAASR